MCPAVKPSFITFEVHVGQLIGNESELISDTAC